MRQLSCFKRFAEEVTGAFGIFEVFVCNPDDLVVLCFGLGGHLDVGVQVMLGVLNGLFVLAHNQELFGLADGLFARLFADLCFGGFIRFLRQRCGGTEAERQASNGCDDMACHGYPESREMWSRALTMLRYPPQVANLTGIENTVICSVK